MEKQLIVAAAFAVVVGATSQADVVLKTDFTGFTSDTNTMTISDFTWTSELGEAANASTDLALVTTNAITFIPVTPGTGGTGPAVGVQSNIRSTSWSTSFTFTPSQALDITRFDVSSYSITWPGGHQTGDKTVVWTLDITSSETNFTGSVTEVEPGGDAPQLFSIDIPGTLDAGTTYTFNLTVAGYALSANNIALDTLTLRNTSSLPPIINAFSADPVSVLSNEMVTLSWDVEDATSLSIDQGIGDVTGMGSTQIVVSADTTYTLTAVNGSYGSTTATTAVTLITTPPVINSFTIDPSSAFSNETVTLSWNVEDAASLSIDQGIGNVTGMSSTQIVVSAGATYTLTADNDNGSTTATAAVTLITTPPIINSFTADQTVVSVGQVVTLFWNVRGADSLAIDQGVGSVTGLTSTQVVVNAATTYILTALNAYGSTDQSVEILIGNPSLVFNGGFESPDVAVDASNVVIDDWNKEAGLNRLDQTLAKDSFASLLPGNPVVGTSQALRMGGTALARISQDLTHDWATNDLFSIDFNASEVYWRAGGAGDNLTVRLVETASGDVLWTSGLINLNGTHAGNVAAADLQDWNAVQTFSYTADAAGFTNGTAGSAISIEFESHGVVSLDNVSLLVESSGPADPVEDIIISGPISSGTEIVISWTGELGKPYGVETNANLILANDWKTFMTGLIGNGGAITVTNTIGADQTFYRVISE